MTHGNTRILPIIMPNPKGHEDSIKNSRFKAAWQSGPTRTIRVPHALADATLEYALQLDRGIEPRDTWVKSDTQIHNKVDNIVTEPRDTAKIQAELDSLRANYDTLLETSTRITTKLRDEVRRLRSALELPEASVLLNKLKAKRKKSVSVQGVQIRRNTPPKIK